MVQLGQVRPAAFYLVSGIMAVAVSQFVSFLFNVFLMRGFAGGVERFFLTYPWLLSTFSTTVITGVLIDNGRFAWCSRW